MTLLSLTFSVQQKALKEHFNPQLLQRQPELEILFPLTDINNKSIQFHPLAMCKVHPQNASIGDVSLFHQSANFSKSHMWVS